jgi:hypothetical protein
MLEKIGKISTDFLNASIVKANKNTVVFTATMTPTIKPTNFGDKLHCTVKCGDSEYTWTMNNTTMDSLIDELGNDEKLWIGKTVKLATMKVQTSDGIKDAIYTEKYVNSQ